MWSVNACVVGTNGPMNRKRAIIKRLIMALKVMGSLEGLLICGETIWIFFFFKFQRFVRDASRNALWTGYGR